MLAMLKTQKVPSVISYYQNDNNFGASKIFQFVITTFTIDVICIFKHYLFCFTLIQVIVCDICAIARLYEFSYICLCSICLWRPQNNGVPLFKYFHLVYSLGVLGRNLQIHFCSFCILVIFEDTFLCLLYLVDI